MYRFPDGWWLSPLVFLKFLALYRIIFVVVEFVVVIVFVVEESIYVLVIRIMDLRGFLRGFLRLGRCWYDFLATLFGFDCRYWWKFPNGFVGLNRN